MTDRLRRRTVTAVIFLACWTVLGDPRSHAAENSSGEIAGRPSLSPPNADRVTPAGPTGGTTPRGIKFGTLPSSDDAEKFDFSRESLVEMLNDAGYEVVTTEGLLRVSGANQYHAYLDVAKDAPYVWVYATLGVLEDPSSLPQELSLKLLANSDLYCYCQYSEKHKTLQLVRGLHVKSVEPKLLRSAVENFTTKLAYVFDGLKLRDQFK